MFIYQAHMYVCTEGRDSSRFLYWNYDNDKKKKNKKKSTSFFIFSPYFVTNTLLITSYGIGVGATMDTTKVDEKEVLVSRKIKAEEGLVEGTFEVLRPGMIH